MPRSHKTLFSLTAKTQKVCLSFKQDIPVPFPLFPYIVVFFSHFLLSNLFFPKTFETGYLSVTNIFGNGTKLHWRHCWNGLLEIWHWNILCSWVKVLFLPQNPSVNDFSLKFTLSPLWMLRGLPWKKREHWESRLDRPPQKIKVIQTMYEALFWGQSHESNSFSFRGINPSLSKGERIPVKFTNINLIMADLCVKSYLYNRAGWWSYTLWSGPDTEYFLSPRGSLHCSVISCFA